jgi:valyl-tRNA synthetase
MAVLLRLFAPFLPYVTEELWRGGLGDGRSIHRAAWPSAADCEVSPPADPGSLARATAALGAINRAKTEAGASVGRLVDHLALAGHPATLARLRPVLEDVLSAVRCPPSAATLVERAEMAEETFAVEALQVRPPE